DGPDPSRDAPMITTNRTASTAATSGQSVRELGCDVSAVGAAPAGMASSGADVVSIVGTATIVGLVGVVGSGGVVAGSPSAIESSASAAAPAASTTGNVAV